MTTKKFKFALLTIALIGLFSIIFITETSLGASESSDHVYELIEAIPATCRENGLNIFRCINCNKLFEQVVYAPGCSWRPWEVYREATCTRSGLYRRQCRECTRSQTEAIPMVEHEFIRNEEEVSCLEAGEVVYACSECGYVDREYVVEALGHEYEEYIIKEPSCLKYGEMEVRCTHCGYIRVESFGESTGHDFEEVITTEATCYNVGEVSFTCINCEYSYTEIIPAMEHNWGDWIVELYPEEGVDGLRVMACAYCGEEITEGIPGLPILPEPEPELRQPIFGVEEVIVGGANVAALYLVYILLFGEISAFLWYRRRKKAILAQMKQRENEKIYGEVL